MSLGNGEPHAVHGAHVAYSALEQAFLNREVDLQSTRVQQRFARNRRGGLHMLPGGARIVPAPGGVFAAPGRAVVKMAKRAVTVRFVPPWNKIVTPVHDLIATRCESATREFRLQRRNKTCNDLQIAAALFHAGQRIEQLAAVRMPGHAEERFPGCLLDDLTGIHDGHPVGVLGDHTKIVGDQQDRHFPLPLQCAQQLQHLRLNGDVQRGGRLIGHQQCGIARQRNGDYDALLHAPGQLMGILL